MDGGFLHCTDIRNSCKFFSENDKKKKKKKKLARAISKNQVSDPGPSWPSCMNELISNPNFTPAEYRTLYPLFLFDVSKQSEKLKYSTTDIQIKMFFNADVPAGTQAFAVTFSDILINFQSDGNKMSVVY